MSKINQLQIDQVDFKRQMRELGIKFEILSGPDVARAQAAALNKGAARVKTAGIQKTAKALGIQQKLIRPRVKVRRANAKTQSAAVWAGMSKGIPLIKLKAREVGGGIQAGNYLVPDGFIATTKAVPKQSDPRRKNPSGNLIGKTHVFKRKSKGRYPLVAQSVNLQPAMEPAIRERAASYMRNEHRAILLQEYKFRVLRKAGIV